MPKGRHMPTARRRIMSVAKVIQSQGSAGFETKCWKCKWTLKISRDKNLKYHGQCITLKKLRRYLCHIAILTIFGHLEISSQMTDQKFIDSKFSISSKIKSKILKLRKSLIWSFLKRENSELGRSLNFLILPPLDTMSGEVKWQIGPYLGYRCSTSLVIFVARK